MSSFGGIKTNKGRGVNGKLLSYQSIQQQIEKIRTYTVLRYILVHLQDTIKS